MADYRTSGAHQLNKWLWSKLQNFIYNGTDKAFADYGVSGIDAVPIVPAQQQPELMEIVGGAPFIVYNYRQVPYSEWWTCQENCAYAIYDSDEERLRAIQNYLVQLLKRQDWAAADVNAYLGSSSKFDFKTIWVSSSQSPSPETDLGGRHGATISVSYKYTANLDGIEHSGLRT